MIKFCKKHEGTIAVFMTLILIPTFIFSGVMIDGSRILASKNLVSGAGDLAMNAALSNYHEPLNEVYGLLAMADSAQEVQSVMQECFEVSLNAKGISKEDFSKALVYLELTEGGFSAADMVDTEIYHTEVFKQEVLEYMKYRAPVKLVDRAIKEKTDELKTMEEEKKAADAEIKFEKELDDIQDLLDELNQLIDLQNQYVNAIGTEQSLNALLKDTKNNYLEITLLAVAYYRLTHCSDSESGEMKSLMEKMTDLSCDLSSITPEVVSKLIKMKRIANAMEGQNTEDLLEGLAADGDEYREIQELIAEYEAAKSVMAEGIEKTGKRLDELVKQSYNAMHDQWACATNGSKNCTDIIAKIGEIKEKLADCKGKYDDWKEAVNNLSNEDSRKAYQESIDEVSGLFENDGIMADFEGKIGHNKVYFDEVIASLDQVTFTGYRIDYDVSSKVVFIGEADYGLLIESSEISNAAKDFMVRYVSPDAMALSGEIEKKVDKRDPFVKKLKEEYCNTDSKNKEEAKRVAKTWKDQLEEKGKKLKELLTSDDIENDNVRDIAGDELPSVWLGISAESDYDEDTVKTEGSLENKKARKKASEGGSDNLNQDNASISGMSSLASKIAGVGESMVEPLFLTEYVLDMFSYYTIEKNRDGSENGDPESLSRAKLKQDALYRAEVEYVLWGSPNARSNVAKSKAIIFAANFVFNMAFAFTNSTLGKQARDIAALFPVGAVGKIAIKCALLTIVATIETTDNMLDLMDGKAVHLVKKADKWKTWLGTAEQPYKEDNAGFTYEDYLWILVCVNMYIGDQQTKLLARTADCIELNLTDKKSIAENTLKDKSTMVKVDAKVGINTFFLQKLRGVGYDVSYDSNAFVVDYHGIQGY
ncbi:MAG: DUF5702 domain-containing protein [Eubacterium sp.]|nr:DUF5702 domain-containing protein [Eubacterium sp.]